MSSPKLDGKYNDRCVTREKCAGLQSPVHVIRQRWHFERRKCSLDLVRERARWIVGERYFLMRFAARVVESKFGQVAPPVAREGRREERQVQLNRTYNLAMFGCDGSFSPMTHRPVIFTAPLNGMLKSSSGSSSLSTTCEEKAFKSLVIGSRRAYFRSIESFVPRSEHVLARSVAFLVVALQIVRVDLRVQVPLADAGLVHVLARA